MAKSKFYTEYLPREVTTEYVVKALKQSQNECGMYAAQNLSELTSISQNKLSAVLSGNKKGKFTLSEMDKISVHADFCMQEFESDVIERFPEWEQIIKEAIENEQLTTERSSKRM